MTQPYIDFNPVSHITIDTTGPPGKRTFYLQARQGTRLISLILEKEQAHALAIAIDELLEKLERQYPQTPKLSETISELDMGLQEPLVPEFRVGQLGLGYDEREDHLILIAYELPQDPEDPVSIARFWATRAQMRALSIHAKEVVAAGRPICLLCGEPIDPEGHFCPRGNGDGQKH